MNSIKKIIFLALTIFSFSALYAQGNNLTIIIEGIEKKGGRLYIGLYNAPETFLKSSLFGTNVPVDDLEVKVQFTDLPTGSYAVGLYLDENNNKKLDKNFLGIPQEPYAFSRNASRFLGAPSFKDCALEVIKDTTIRINID